MAKKLSTKEFIEKSIEIHGGKFSYDLTEYKGKDKRVTVVCTFCKQVMTPSASEFNRKCSKTKKGIYTCSNSMNHYKYYDEKYLSLQDAAEALKYTSHPAIYIWLERMNISTQEVEGRVVILEEHLNAIKEFREDYLNKSKELNLKFRRNKQISNICNICNKEHQYTGFIYKWTNQINGKWYIGSHDGCVEDGYIGSSLFLSRAVTKYGIKNFQRDILFYSFQGRMELYDIETEILEGCDARNNKMSYNMKNVGVGADPKVVGDRFRGKKIPREIVEKQRKSLIESGKVAGVNNPRSQKVICLDNKEVFDYGRLAANAVKGTEAGISEACHKGYKHRGKHWMFYDEYLELGEPEENPRYTNSGKAKWRVVRLSDGKVFETALEAAREHGKSSFIQEIFLLPNRTFAGHYWMKYSDWATAGYPLRIPPKKQPQAVDRVVDMVTGIIYSSTVKCGIATGYSDATVRKHCSGDSSVQRFVYEEDWEKSEKILINDPGKKNVPIPVVNLTKKILFKNMRQAANYERINVDSFKRKMEGKELINGNEYRRQNEPRYSSDKKSNIQLSFDIR